LIPQHSDIFPSIRFTFWIVIVPLTCSLIRICTLLSPAIEE